MKAHERKKTTPKLTVKATVPHLPGDGAPVPDVAPLVERLVQRHPEQVNAVEERPDEKVHLLVLDEGVVVVPFGPLANLFGKILVRGACGLE